MAEAVLELDIGPALDALDDISSAFDKMVDNFGDGLNDALSSLDSSISDLGDTFNRVATEFGDSISESLDATDTAVAGIGTALDEAASGFGTTISESLDSVDVTGIGTALDEAASGFGENLLPQIDEVRGALTDATAGFGDGLDDAITGPLLPQVEEVAAALGEIAPNLEDSFGEIDTSSLTGAAQDVGELDEGLDTLEANIGGTASGMDILNASSGALQATTGLLVGDSRSLFETMVPGAAIFGGVAAAIGGLVEKADDANLSVQRLDDVFGSHAGDVFDSKLEHLNGTLEELNTKAGGSNTRLREAVTTFGQTAVGAGATQKEAATLGKNFGELAETVTLLNPKLGTADQNFQLIVRGLGGSTRILQRYGITIDKAAQSQLALQIAQEHGRDAANLFDKQVAGSVLTMQALEQQSKDMGTTLQDRVNKGLESSTVQFRRLKQEIQTALVEVGKPLVGPVLEIVTTLQPVFVKLIGIVGQLLAKILPALVPIAKAAVEVLDAMTPLIKVFEKIPAPVLTAIAAFYSLKKVGDLISPIFKGLDHVISTSLENIGNKFGKNIGQQAEQLTLFGGAAETAGSKAGKFSIDTSNAGAKILGAAAGIGVGVSSMHDFGKSVEGTIGTMGGFISAGASLGAFFPEFGGPLVGAAIGGLAGLTAGLLSGGESVIEYRKHFTELSDEMNKSGLSGEKAFKKFIDTLGDTDRATLGIDKVHNGIVDFLKIMETSTGTGGVKAFADQTRITAKNIKGVTDEIRTMAIESPAAAQEIVGYFNVLRNGKGHVALTWQAQQDLNKALDKGTRIHAEASIAAEAYAQKSAALEQTLRDQRFAQDESLQAAVRWVKAVEAQGKIVDDLVPKFGKLSEGFEGAFSKATEISKFLGRDGVVDVQSFGTALEQTGAQGKEFANNLKVLIDNGLGFLASEIAQKGPEAGGKLAAEIAKGLEGDEKPGLAAAQQMQKILIQMEAQKFVFQSAIKNLWGKGIASEFTTQFDEAAQATATGFGAVIIRLQDGTPKLVGAGSDQAKALAAAFIAGLKGEDVPSVVDKDFDEAGNRIEKNETAPAKAKAAGKKHGKKIPEGAVEGINEGAPAVDQAVTDMIPTGGVGAEDAGKTIGTRFGGSISGGITDKKSEIHGAAVDVIPTGGVGAEDWGRTIGIRWGAALAEGIRSQEGPIHEAGRSVIPTGGLGAEDWGHIIGTRFGHALGDGIHDSFGYVRDSAEGIIPTGGLGAQDAGYTIGERFGLAMAKGMYDTGDEVYATGQYLARLAAAGAANAGSPSEHLFSDLGEIMIQALIDQINAMSPEAAQATMDLVKNMTVSQQAQLASFFGDLKASAAGTPLVTENNITSLGAGDTSTLHMFEDGSGITDAAYEAKWGIAWAYETGQQLTQAFLDGINNAGSPSEHLFIEAGQALTRSFAKGVEMANRELVARSMPSAAQFGLQTAAAASGNQTVIDKSQKFESGAIRITTPATDPRIQSMEIARRLRVDQSLRYR